MTSWDFDNATAANRLLEEIRCASGAETFDLAIILGSGWGAATDDICCYAEFLYRDWPCFPAGQVIGHAGRLKVLNWKGWKVLAFLGRWHCYQGGGAYSVTVPVRLAASLGVQRVVLTCAAGGINRNYDPGDFMLISDHLNLLGDNPLKGPAAPFIDLTSLYRTKDFDALAATARLGQIRLHRGILAGMLGPSYETPAEIVMLERLGADAVAMSIIPEAIMARCLKQEVVALALIANHAAGRAHGVIDHADVLSCGASATSHARELLEELINCWQMA